MQCSEVRSTQDEDWTLQKVDAGGLGSGRLDIVVRYRRGMMNVHWVSKRFGRFLFDAVRDVADGPMRELVLENFPGDKFSRRIIGCVSNSTSERNCSDGLETQHTI